jgi:hypothetical protein
MKRQVPNEIGEAKTLFYTEMDNRHIKTENTRHSVNRQLIENINGLAICKYDNDPGCYLFGCDENWSSITDTYHDSIEEAKEQAEFEYKNSAATWTALETND